jgi:hypothetical protein
MRIKSDERGFPRIKTKNYLNRTNLPLWRQQNPLSMRERARVREWPPSPLGPVGPQGEGTAVDYYLSEKISAVRFGLCI